MLGAPWHVRCRRDCLPGRMGLSLGLTTTDPVFRLFRDADSAMDLVLSATGALGFLASTFRGAIALGELLPGRAL